MRSLDANTAAAYIAYYFSEVCALYPITPSTPMGEMVDEWASKGIKNMFGSPVLVAEMQSEAGAAGALHGALSGGAFCSTFTASQGLLLMIPNMYKIAGEVMPTVFHVSARSLASHALSIFGDHQDVMATRSTGFSILASSSVQEALDLALVCHLASLRSSMPFLHFFDGFRTSHEIHKVDDISYDDIAPLIDWKYIKRHRERALNPNRPHLRGSAQNPDIYFQNMEASNPFIEAIPGIVEEEMKRVSSLTKREYSLFDYFGDRDAEYVIVIMGSGAECAEEAISYLNGRGEKFGLIKVRLYRPFSREHFLKKVPASCKKLAVLDRTRENPLYLDVSEALCATNKIVIGGRYGLGSKEFTPSMVGAIFDNLKEKSPKNHFTVGIVDDVTNHSLDISNVIDSGDRETVRCKFWGLGGDGTVGANKEAIKIIGDNTDKHVQGYFSYDSKKSFGITISHLRFGNRPIKSPYLIKRANYIACHNPSYVDRYDILEGIEKGGVFLLNSPWSLEEMEEKLPPSLKRKISENNVSFFNIDAKAIASAVGLGNRINMPMQVAFFKLSGIIPIEDAIKYLNDAIYKSYIKKGEEVVEKNKKAVEMALEKIERIDYPKGWKDLKEEEGESNDRPKFIREVFDVINRQKGDSLPVSKFEAGGIFPLSTTKYEKRGLTTYTPVWKAENCIQCNRCSFVCPHSVIRPFLMTEEERGKAPPGYKGIPAVGKDMEGLFFSIEIASMDCTGCGNCILECPAKEKALEPKAFSEVGRGQAALFEYARGIEKKDVAFPKYSVKGSQFEKPLFEFSGACGGCGETPYIKLLTQLYGSRLIVANATGCSSIYGGSAPSVPWTVNSKKEGPAWANSLFEDNAEYGFGMVLAMKKRRENLKGLVEEALEGDIDEGLKALFKSWLDNMDDGERAEEISSEILDVLEGTGSLKEIYERRDLFKKPSIWVVGGDGWAYDIGFGGLDHVIAMNEDINILVLDTEVYSNTGGQASKATPLGAIAKFAASGKKTMKKDLGIMMISYGNAYVASVALGADKNQVVKAFREAESYRGPSLIIGYSSCISHGIKGGMIRSQEVAKDAVEAGYWFNYRYDPRLKGSGKKAFMLDSGEPSFEVEKYLEGQTRYDYLMKKDPEMARKLHEELREFLKGKYQVLKKLSEE